MKIKPCRMNTKGVSLIIVIFAMMLFAMLGWTLATMITTDFDANLRNLDFERALYLAESGAQWALGQLNQSFDCAAINGSSYPHTLSYGQYECSCDNSLGAILSVISTGYVPSKSDYLAMRQIKVEVTQAGSVNAATGGELFNWQGASPITVNGDIVSQNFLPTAEVPGTGTRTISSGPAAVPPIDMGWFETHADRIEVSTVEHPFTISNNYNNQGIVFVKGPGGVTIETGNKGNQGVNIQHTTIISEGDIRVTGVGYLSMMSHVNNSTHIAYPNLATAAGNITTSAPVGNELSKRDFDGLVYSHTGILSINCIQGIAVMGRMINLSGNVFLSSKRADKYVNTVTGFSTSEFASVTWQEQ